MGCTSLADITIPESVETTASAAFASCRKLTGITPVPMQMSLHWNTNIFFQQFEAGKEYLCKITEISGLTGS